MDLKGWEFYSATGLPVSAATVEVWDAVAGTPGGAPITSTSTDANGMWSFTGLTNTPKDVKVTLGSRYRWYKGLTQHSMDRILLDDGFVGKTLVNLTNKSGGSVAAGDVVIIDTTNAASFTTTTTEGNSKVLGVAIETIANNATGLVATHGIVNVQVNASTAIGDWITTSTTAKQGKPNTNQVANAFARALASGGPGLVSCLLLGTPLYFSVGNNYLRNSSLGFTGPLTTTFTDISDLTIDRAGTWLIFCTVTAQVVPNPATGLRLNARFLKNGATVTDGDFPHVGPGVDGAGVSYEVNTSHSLVLTSLAVSDVIKVQAKYSATGTPTSVYARPSHLTAIWLGS